MWYLKKGGVRSGPFTDNQVRERLNLGMAGPLDGISSDGQRWQTVRDSEFWKQERTIPDPHAAHAGRKISLAQPQPAISVVSPSPTPASARLSRPTSSKAEPVEVANEASSNTQGTAETSDTAQIFEYAPNEVAPVASFSIWKLIFGGVFHRHSGAAVASILNGNGQRANPEGFYPKTWLWSRIWLWSVILSIVTLILALGNPKILPGFFMVAAFGVPVAMVLLFLECDVTRRVSAWKAAGIFVVGGVFSLLATTIFHGTEIGGLLTQALGAGAAGPIEESAKMLILFPFLAKPKRYPNVLNGLLIGATVGAGFAAFETAGYVFDNAFMASFVGDGMDYGDAIGESAGLAIYRSIFAPFCHIAWTASIGGALWKARGVSQGFLSAFSKISTWGVIILSMLFHLLWNWGLGGLSLIGVAPWAIIIHYLAHGYGEPTINRESVGRKNAN